MAQHVAVTGQLTTALAQTKVFTDNIMTSHRVNDANRYNDVVERLSGLTSAYFAAVGGMLHLLAGPVTGPRFDAGAGTELAQHVTACVEYLREDASERIKDSATLSAYERKHVDTALGYLKGLYGRLMSAIEDEVVADLRTLRTTGPVALIAAGDIIGATGKRIAEQQKAPSLPEQPGPRGPEMDR